MEIFFSVADNSASSSSIVESSNDEDSIDFIIRDKKNNIVFRFNPKSSLSKIGIIFPSKVVDGVIQTKVVEHNISLDESYIHMEFCFDKISFKIGQLKLETDLGKAFSDLSDLTITHTNSIRLDVEKKSCVRPTTKNFLNTLHPLALVAIVFACCIAFIGVFVGFLKFLQWIQKRKGKSSS